LISFGRHPEIYPSDRAGADPKIGASAHRSDEFPAGYSLTGCSAAEPVSASPADGQYALFSQALFEILLERFIVNRTIHPQRIHLIQDGFWSKNGVHLNCHGRCIVYCK
jgi:hypothetical protein